MHEENDHTNMKDSHEAWMREIPCTWDVRPLKYIFSIQKNIAGELGHTVLSVTQRGIVPKDMDKRGQFALDYSKYQIVHVGDFVMNHMDLLTGWVDISQYDGVTSPDYRVFVNTNTEAYISEYYKYIFQFCYSNRIFYGLGQGVAGFGRWRLPADMFLNFILPVPPVEEQIAIARFLDEKCTKINEMIDEAKSNIADYEAWKQSIIYETVLHGLNPLTKMKDIDSSWISQIPTHWDVVRLKSCFDKRDGGAWGVEPQNNGRDTICLRIADFDYSKFSFKKDCDYTFRNYEQKTIDRLLLQNGDLLIEKSGGGEKTPVGRVVIYDLNEPALFANFMERLRCSRDVFPKWMVYLLAAFYSTRSIKNYIKQTTGLQNLDISSLLTSEKVPCPSIDEQKEIAYYLDRKCAKIDAMIAEKEALIPDLEQYKRSLIYETVTGKRKVV